MQHRRDRDKPNEEGRRAPAAIHSITKALRDSCQSVGGGIAQVLSLTTVDEVMKLTISAQLLTQPFMNDFHFEFYLKKGYRVDPKTYEYVEDIQGDYFRVGYLPRKINILRALTHLEREFGTQLLNDFFTYLKRGVDSVSSKQLMMYSDPRDERIKGDTKTKLNGEDRKVIQLTRQIDVEHLPCVTNVLIGDSVIGMNCTNDLLKANTAQCAISGMTMMQGHRIIRTMMKNAIRAENVYVYLGTNDLIKFVRGKDFHQYTREDHMALHSRKRIRDDYSKDCEKKICVIIVITLAKMLVQDDN